MKPITQTKRCPCGCGGVLDAEQIFWPVLIDTTAPLGPPVTFLCAEDAKEHIENTDPEKQANLKLLHLNVEQGVRFVTCEQSGDLLACWYLEPGVLHVRWLSPASYAPAAKEEYRYFLGQLIKPEEVPPGWLTALQWKLREQVKSAMEREK